MFPVEDLVFEETIFPFIANEDNVGVFALNAATPKNWPVPANVFEVTVLLLTLLVVLALECVTRTPLNSPVVDVNVHPETVLLFTLITAPAPAALLVIPVAVPVVIVDDVNVIALPVIVIVFGLTKEPPEKPQVIPIILEVVADVVKARVLFLISPQTPDVMLIPVTVLVEPVPPVIVLLQIDNPR